MIDPSKESVLKFQKSFKEKYGVNYSYEEAHEAAYNLYSFFETLMEIDREQKSKSKKKSKD